MHGQMEANEFLAKRIKELEGRVAIAENEKNVMNAVSGIIPTQEVFNAEPKRD